MNLLLVIFSYLKGSFGIILLLVFSFKTYGVDADPLDFNRDIRPILSDRCFFCHGPDAHDRKADLRLDTREGAIADLGGYAAIVPHEIDESELVLRILDEEDPMPPVDSHKKLSKSEKGILSRWIKEGAEYSAPWAYVNPINHAEIGVKDESWPINWIDNFVLAQLENNGLKPSVDTDQVTLIRRIYFDLVGLPPTPEEVKDFVEGKITFELIVDKLLDSKHFGERISMYWLDLVRFADTVGYHGDQDHNIAPYRDYVIRSFNQNLPFDQFTREQLAGDLLEDPDKWQKVASGYNRLLQTSHEGGIQAKEYNAIYAADRVRNVSAVWMGATIGCAQCHDHKYDPYTIKDHYSMAAFFADIHDTGFTGNSLPTVRPPEILFLPDGLEDELKNLKDEQIKLVGFKTLKLVEQIQNKILKLKKSDKGKEQEFKKKLAVLIPAEKKIKSDQLAKRIKEIEKKAVKTMITVAKEPRTMRVLPRGNWLDDSGEVIQSAVPEFLGSIQLSKGERATRLHLANWLTDTKDGAGGLTARVFANRFWYLFFGRGLSSSLSDFGGQGNPPSNPELLDQLAMSFYQNGWSVKRLIRTIVTSRAYRQSSIVSKEMHQLDPSNELVARQSRYRLPAELIRDNALFVSGLLVDEFGGPSVKPYQPKGYFRHLNFPKRVYHSHSDSRQWRRGLYVHWQRMFLHPMMKALDAPSREECTAERARSNTPNAALVLLNDPTFVEAARAFSQRILQKGGNSFEERVRFAYSLVLSRQPDEEEISIFRSLYESTKAGYVQQPSKAEDLLQTVKNKPKSKKEIIELASWVAVSRGLLNLNETNTRN